MKGIAYLRVSTEQQDLIRQESLISEYVLRHDIELVKKFEDKETGTTFNRKGLQELLNCNKNDGDLVIISEISRFARSADIIEFLSQISKVLQNGLNLVFLDKPDTIYKAGQDLNISDLLILIVGAYTASQERNLILQRLAAKREYLIKQNPYSYHGCTNYWGFNIVPNPEYSHNKSVAKRILKVDEKKADIIREIFKRYSEGETSYSIWRWFCSLNIEDKRGRTFIMKMLNNPIYIGERLCGGNIYKIAPIISKDVWDKVRNRKAENKIYYSNVRNHALNLLKGLIKCGKCGASMTVMYPPISRKRSRDFYTCLHKIEDKIPKNGTKCKSFNIQRDLIEDIVWRSYHEIIGDDAFNDATKNHLKILEKKLEKNLVDLKYIDKEIMKYDEQIKKSKEAIIKFMDDKELAKTFIDDFHAYTEKKESCNKEKKNYEEENIMLQQQINELKTKPVLERDNLEISRQELAKQYQSHIKSVTIYSKKQFNHFVQIIYKNKYCDTFLVSWWFDNIEVYNVGNGQVIIEEEIPYYIYNGAKYEWSQLLEICRKQTNNTI